MKKGAETKQGLENSYRADCKQQINIAWILNSRNDKEIPSHCWKPALELCCMEKPACICTYIPCGRLQGAPGGSRETPGGSREAPGGSRDGPGKLQEAPGAQKSLFLLVSGWVLPLGFLRMWTRKSCPSVCGRERKRTV